VGLLATTLMLCEGAVGVQETAFSAALQGATTWAIAADGTLTLSGAGDIVAKPSS
jgi:heat shock protein HslJ